MTRWSWRLGAVAVVVAVEATVTCDEQYLNCLLERAGVAFADVAACSEASNYAFDTPQVPANGQILVDVCASDTCVGIIQALDGLSDCSLPNCSATASMASWSSASQDFDVASSGSSDSAATVTADDITKPTAASTPISTPTGGSTNAGATVGASLVALLAPALELLL